MLHRLGRRRGHLRQRRLSRGRLRGPNRWRGGGLGRRRRRAGRLQRQHLLRLHQRQHGRRRPGLLPPLEYGVDGAVAHLLLHRSMSRVRTGPSIEERLQPGRELGRGHRPTAGPAVVGHRPHPALVAPRHHPAHGGRRHPEGPRHLLAGDLALAEHHRDQDVSAGHVVAVETRQQLAAHEHRERVVLVGLDAPAATEPDPVGLRLQHARQHRTACHRAHGRQHDLTHRDCRASSLSHTQEDRLPPRPPAKHSHAR